MLESHRETTNHVESNEQIENLTFVNILLELESSEFVELSLTRRGTSLLMSALVSRGLFVIPSFGAIWNSMELMLVSNIIILLVMYRIGVLALRL